MAPSRRAPAYEPALPRKLPFAWPSLIKFLDQLRWFPAELVDSLGRTLGGFNPRSALCVPDRDDG